MNTLAVKPEPLIHDVRLDCDYLFVSLLDGREIRVPLEWFPKLKEASAAERQNFRLIGHGIGIHWPDIDEDISVTSLLRR